MIVLDSNIWIALFNEEDALHDRAQRMVRDLQGPVAIPEYVILEVATILSQKAGKPFADLFLQKTYQNSDIKALHSSEQFLNEVIQLYLFQSRGKLSFVDYALLALSQHNIKVVTFDKDLERALKNVPRA